MSANDVKFTKFQSFVPKDHKDNLAFLNSVINTWQALDMRNADKEMDGIEPEEMIQIIANSNVPEKSVIVSRLTNNMSEGNRLTAEDEANAVLISRAPAMYVLFRAIIGLIQHDKEISKDSLLVKASDVLLREIEKGEINFRLEMDCGHAEPTDPLNVER